MTNFTALRATMVASQLRTVGVNDPAVVAAMLAVPREKFVPAGREALAYADAAVPLGGGRFLPEPLVTGLLLTHARIEPHHRVLVVGAGTGYSAAVIRHLTDHVVAVEDDAGLAAQARANGVAVTEGPLVDGAPDAAPFDLIFFDGAIERVPPALAAQLAGNGRAAAVVRTGSGPGRATVGRIVGEHLVGDGFVEVPAALLPGFKRAPEFTF